MTAHHPHRSLSHCQCGQKFGVTETRTMTVNGVQTIWRRRKCHTCGTALKTVEIIEAAGLEFLGKRYE